MENMKIIFNDGTELVAVRNGDCFITAEKPDFPADLSTVTVGEETLENVSVVECASTDGRYWFAFREMSPEEIWRAEIEDALCDLSKEG
jgi:hypothetical protein